MTVQIQPAKPKDQHNGLADLEDSLLANDEQTITAVVTYRVAKIVNDKKKDETYPVLYLVHIEPLLDGLGQKGQDLLGLAYKKRTGENELSFDTIDETAAEDDSEADE